MWSKIRSTFRTSFGVRSGHHPELIRIRSGPPRTRSGARRDPIRSSQDPPDRVPGPDPELPGPGPGTRSRTGPGNRSRTGPGALSGTRSRACPPGPGVPAGHVQFPPGNLPLKSGQRGRAIGPVFDPIQALSRPPPQGRHSGPARPGRTPWLSRSGHRIGAPDRGHTEVDAGASTSVNLRMRCCKNLSDSYNIPSQDCRKLCRNHNFRIRDPRGSPTSGRSWVRGSPECVIF